MFVTLGSNAEIFVGCDPATGSDATRGDYSALVSVVRDRKTELMYVIDAKFARMVPHDLINEIVIRNKEWRYDTVITENNGFQVLFARELDRRLHILTHRPRLKALTNTGNKQARIQSLQGMVVSGRILFSSRHRQLIDQLIQFPHARHDDGPDALEMAVRIASKSTGDIYWITI